MSGQLARCLSTILLISLWCISHSSTTFANNKVHSNDKKRTTNSTPTSSLIANIKKDLHWDFQLRVFAGYRATFRETQSFNEFDLHELQTQLAFHWKKRLGVSTRFEVLRSAQPQSLFGIDGDAYIIRLQRAWGYGNIELGPTRWELRFGLIRDPWLDLMEQGYDIRDVSRLLSQGGNFFAPSDLGVSFIGMLWDGFVEIRATWTNGEGTNRSEQNPGKNMTLTLSLRPLRMQLLGEPAELAIHGVYRDGSQGTSYAKSHRLGGGLTFRTPHYNAGVEFVSADGWQNDGSLKSNGLGVWLSAILYAPWLGLTARLDRLNSNTEVEGATIQRLSVGLFSNLLPGSLWKAGYRFRLYALYQNESAGKNAGPFPGFPQASQAHRIVAICSIYFGLQDNK